LRQGGIIYGLNVTYYFGNGDGRPDPREIDVPEKVEVGQKKFADQVAGAGGFGGGLGGLEGGSREEEGGGRMEEGGRRREEGGGRREGESRRRRRAWRRKEEGEGKGRRRGRLPVKLGGSRCEGLFPSNRFCLRCRRLRLGRKASGLLRRGD
jgi:hypothetical protein